MSLALTHPANPNTIVLKGKLANKREEGYVAATKTIKPGQLVERTGTNTDPYNGSYQPHSTAGGGAATLYVAEEWGLVGDPNDTRVPGGTIDDTFAAGDPFPYHIPQRGDVLWMLLATANNAVLTGYLTSNGDGSLKVGNGTTDVRLFKPLEAINNTTGAPVRIRAEAL